MSMLRSSALGEMGPWRLGGTTWYCIGSALGTDGGCRSVRAHGLEVLML